MWEKRGEKRGWRGYGWRWEERRLRNMEDTSLCSSPARVSRGKIPGKQGGGGGETWHRGCYFSPDGVAIATTSSDNRWQVNTRELDLLLINVNGARAETLREDSPPFQGTDRRALRRQTFAYEFARARKVTALLPRHRNNVDVCCSSCASFQTPPSIIPLFLVPCLSLSPATCDRLLAC